MNKYTVDSYLLYTAGLLPLFFGPVLGVLPKYSWWKPGAEYSARLVQPLVVYTVCPEDKDTFEIVDPLGPDPNSSNTHGKGWQKL